MRDKQLSKGQRRGHMIHWDPSCLWNIQRRAAPAQKLRLYLSCISIAQLFIYLFNINLVQEYTKKLKKKKRAYDC